MSPPRDPRARDEALARWRLVLGEGASAALGSAADLDERGLACDAALAWLYDREPTLADREIRDRRGDTGRSQLTVPAWLDEIHRLFPRETVERLERDAIERFDIHEVVTSPEVLARAEPNATLLKAVLRTKHLMSAEVLAMARELVARVIKRLVEAIARDLRRSFTGARTRRRSLAKAAESFDAKGTVRANLGTFDRTTSRIVIKRPLFFSRARRRGERWQVILLVDESASMLGSVIHAAVTAACLWGLPSVSTHLCIFDTDVVDLTSSVSDPVEILMRVQLGGATDIGKAVGYAAGLIEAPRRALVVLITDFFEGASRDVLVRRVKSLCDQGTTVLGLAALDERANPDYDRDLAERLVAAGAHVGAMTPGELASWIAEKIR